MTEQVPLSDLECSSSSLLHLPLKCYVEGEKEEKRKKRRGDKDKEKRREDSGIISVQPK